MLRACSKCGRVHDSSYKCSYYPRADKEEARLRNLSKWHKKSEEIRDRSFNLCAICQDLGEVNYLGIEVHHIIKLKDDPKGLLDDENLIALCSYHHKKADKGEYDIDYLRQLVRKRDLKSNDIGSLI